MRKLIQRIVLLWNPFQDAIMVSSAVSSDLTDSCKCSSATQFISWQMTIADKKKGNFDY